jgi:DNA-binding MarR family transcriptional regulator
VAPRLRGALLAPLLRAYYLPHTVPRPRALERDTSGVRPPRGRTRRAPAATRNRWGDYELLARVRRSLRALNNAIARGAQTAGLTLQQQAFLLALAAYGGRAVPFADVREELEMDQATASALLIKLMEGRWVLRKMGSDRRAADVTVTAAGWRIFRRSVAAIRSEVRRADHRDELGALRDDLDVYLGYYLAEPRRRTPRARARPPRRA